MAYLLEIKQEAKDDIVKGFLWYESKKEGLGTKLVSEIESVIEYIGIYPFHYQIRTKSFREAVLKIFPFVVVYEVNQNKVIVYSVFPTRKNPSSKGV